MARNTKSTNSRRRAAPNGNGNGSHRLFDDILALAGTLARGRKDSGADKLMSLAASTRDFAASLTDMPNLRVRAASAAESMEGLADYVLHTEIERMLDDAGTFARRHPVMTMAMSVGAGLAASRYLRPGSAPASRPSRPAAAKRPRPRKKVAQPRSKADGQARASA